MWYYIRTVLKCYGGDIVYSMITHIDKRKVGGWEVILNSEGYKYLPVYELDSVFRTDLKTNKVSSLCTIKVFEI